MTKQLTFREETCIESCKGIGTGEMSEMLRRGVTLKDKFAELVEKTQVAAGSNLQLLRAIAIFREEIESACCGTVMDKSEVIKNIDTFLATMELPHMRRVVCAANRYGDTLLLGARHWDKQMHAQADAIGFVRANYEREEQGFIDQYGVFMTRQEAWDVAKAAGQIIRRVGGDEGCLYSENLY